jgi:CheY-like chemotaxis protein
MTDCKTVIVVDDEEDVRENLRDLLEASGFRVETAANGADALQRLRAVEHPCVILLDLLMPVMDGWQFLAEMSRDPLLAPIPVCICTSAPDRAPAGYALLKKPVDVVVLLDEVRRNCA